LRLSRQLAEPGARFSRKERPGLLGSSADPSWSLLLEGDRCRVGGQVLESEAAWRGVIEAGALDRVEGAFALAVRSAGDALTLARDPLGQRSLYYTVQRGELWFGSSLIALCEASGLERRLSLRAVATFLAYAYVPHEHTLLEGVFEVLPGETVTFHAGGLQRRAFWQVPAEPDHYLPEPELEAELRAALEDETRWLLPEAGPVAASLSGGVDSSLVVALAKKLHAGPVHTFSITFGDAYRDELPWSSLVAEHCDTLHTVLELTPRVIAAHLDDTVACLGKPNGDPLTVPNALLFRAMAEVAPVALNGEGGDPCFGGPKNQPMLLAELYADGAEAFGTERSYLRAHLKCFDDLAELLTPEALSAACSPPLEAELSPWFEDPRWKTLISCLTAINIRFKGGHHILPKLEALSAPFGVRARSPLFGKQVVELACRIPPELKLHGSIEKYLLKRAVRDLLPEAILDRPKSGMLVPVEGWFQGPLATEARDRILGGLAPLGIFRRAYLERLLDGKLGGLRPRHGVKIWLLVSLEAHLRTLGVKLSA
jgi:asparagine synthase (glutamine-hydrolysing)